MKFWKKPLWRVPLVLGALGVINRLLHLAGGLIWGFIQQARGLGPDGTYVLTTGYVTEIVAVISFLLFWWAGWRFVRGLPRREIFASATVMVIVYAALLAAEQLSQAAGAGFAAVYRLYALAGGKSWVDQLFFRLAGEVSVPMVIPGLFAPYLYLIFGRRDPA